VGKGLRIYLQNSIHMFAILAKDIFIEHCMGKSLEEYYQNLVISLGDGVSGFLFSSLCFFLLAF